jgi:predicted transposase/invertase (TIGR01784 family)
MEPQKNRAQLMDPKNDLVFKYYFSKPKNKSILISFIEAVIEPESPIEDLEVLNPTVEQDALEDKISILDLKVKLKNGSFIDVEMQVARTNYFRNRILYYWSKLHGSQLKVGSSYKEINPTISICVLGYKEFDDNDDELHSIFVVKEKFRNTLLNSDLEIHFLELPKYKKWRRKADHKNLDYWTRFLELKNASESEIEELKKEPEMDKAIKALEEVSQDARLKELVELREKNQFAYNADMKEQFIEGKAEGIMHERTLLIRNAAKNGLTVEMISNVLEIPIEIVMEALKS